MPAPAKPILKPAPPAKPVPKPATPPKQTPKSPAPSPRPAGRPAPSKPPAKSSSAQREYEMWSEVFSPKWLNIAVVVAFGLFSPRGWGTLDAGTALIAGLVLLIGLPYYSLYQAYKRGEVDLDLTVHNRRVPVYERWLPYGIAAVVVYGYFGATLLFALSVVFLEVTAGLILFTRYTKVSLHTAWAASTVTSFAAAFGPAFWVMALYLLPIAYFRYKLSKHNWVQLVLGAFVGFVFTWYTYALLL